MEDPRLRPELLPFARWLGSQIRDRRLGKNQVALHLGVSQSSVSEYTRALRRPRLETLRKMAEYFDIPLADLEALLPSAPDALADTRGAYDAPGQRLPQDLLRELEAVTPMLLPRREQTASAGNGNVVDAEYVAFWPTPEQRHHRIEPITVSGDCLEPRLLAGHTAIVDYEAAHEVAPGRDADTAPIVLARHQGEEIFKAYVVRDGERFLEALDGRAPIPVGPDTELLGVVVEARYRLDRRRRR